MINFTDLINSITLLGGKIKTQLAGKVDRTEVATTGAKGIVQLSSATNSTSAALAATPAAVKVAVDAAAVADGKAVTAQAKADAALPAAQKGAASGVASLDAGQKVPVAQIPLLDVAQLNAGVLPLNRGGTAGYNMAARNVTISTAAPSGGADGDIWLQYS